LVAPPPSLNVGVAVLTDLVSRLVDVILSLEAERGELSDGAVLSYVHDAVTTEIRHRRRTRELTGTLSAIERLTTPVPGGAASANAGIAPSPPAAAPRTLPAKSTARPDPEEAFYQALVAERAPVHLRCLGGYEVPSAILRDVGPHALLLETVDGPELFLKRNVISIVRS
jgi:hypothetical protein